MHVFLCFDIRQEARWGAHVVLAEGRALAALQAQRHAQVGVDLLEPAPGLAPLLRDIAGIMRCEDDPSSDAWHSAAQRVSTTPFKLTDGTILKAAEGAIDEESSGGEEERENEDEEQEHREL